MVRVRRNVGVGVAGALVLAVLAGCTPARDTATPATPTASSASPATATATPTPTATATPTPTATEAPAPSAVPSADPVAPVAPPVETIPAPVEVVPVFDKSANSIDDPNSLWIVSNKLRPLNPLDWTPPDIVSAPVQSQNPPRMRQIASTALVTMFAASVAEGAGAMQVQSAWRSYDVQVRVYNGWVSSLGQAQADAQSARPGFSEHQTGLAVDISPVPLSCALDACFGNTPQGLWLAANAWRFGFLLRYPADKTPVTGYTYEPWHFRYIGVELATEMHTQGVTTLEEFFGLPAAPDYAAG